MGGHRLGGPDAAPIGHRWTRGPILRAWTGAGPDSPQRTPPRRPDTNVTDLDRETLKGFIAAFHQAFPDFTITIDESLSDNDVSAHRWTCRGTYTGESPLLPTPPTGKPAQATGSHFAHWHDGMPTEIWHNGDWLGWLQNCGVVPALG
jgi:predicted ester cyclase